jgi:LysM repeat protein/ABC-type branched-subunit amino acid transport system substrate-binding protein
LKRLLSFFASGAISILLCTVLSLQIQAQEAPVIQKSKEKTTIEGKTYYLHTVKKGETLFSISKAYGIGVKEILSANSQAIDGIKTDQVLKIPVLSEKGKSFEKIDSDEFIYHIAQAGQTLYSITKQYSISQEELIKNNPELEVSSLQVGQVVKIPKNRTVKKDTTITKLEKQSITHTIEKDETLYSISRKYNVEIDEIVKANESLQAGELKVGQKIIIPVTVKTNTKEVKSIPDTNKSVNKNHISSKIIKSNCDSAGVTCDTSTPYRLKGNYNIAVILPFYLKENETNKPSSGKTVSEDDDAEKSDNGWVYYKSSNFLEFYEGTLLAIDSLRKAGLSVNLSVFDCDKDTVQIKRIIKSKKLDNMDLIIGPAYAQELHILAAFAKSNGIPVVSPLSNKYEALENNPYVFQVQPTMQTEMGSLARFISDTSKKNFFILQSGSSEELDMVTELKKDLQPYLDSNKLKTERYSKNKVETINKQLESGITNYIFLASLSEAYVTDVLNQLYSQSKTYKIKIIGLPSWHRFKNIDADMYTALDVHYYTPFVIDYTNKNVKKFLISFRNTYNYEPYRTTTQGYNYAFLGYDIMYYFGTALSQYGKQLSCCISSHHPSCLMSGYKFEHKNHKNGFENHSVYLINYDIDFNMSKIDL